MRQHDGRRATAYVLHIFIFVYKNHYRRNLPALSVDIAHTTLYTETAKNSHDELRVHKFFAGKSRGGFQFHDICNYSTLYRREGRILCRRLPR